ncbi:MAG TPA: DapH/DapD/GlmU-related protein [Candidatus Paceibacterota bacterium]|nr:DapH/DapD/GlmU-related protein [Candidatus Pacearchaeota archaeon]HRZ50680.1 DapH/DapD/GlmU-related protein [Candidatus Paceibacterota bacterium]HSA36423.1 DapH/DapD/GlmU-related protein [Candidatus Paceibacterota bacterium]
MDPTIHKTAEVSSEAKIGNGTKIWQNAQITKGSVIGDNCTIGHNCAIFGAKLGNGVKLQANTDVWVGVVLEDYVFVGPSAVFTNDPNPRAKYPKKDFPQYGQWLPTRVMEGASIGANATIICGSVIGKWAFVGAGAVVKGNVPDYAVVAGVPAKQIGWMCECGSKLAFKPSKPAKPVKFIKQVKLEIKETAKCLVCGRIYNKKDGKVEKIKE